MTNPVAELFGFPTTSDDGSWGDITNYQNCPFLNKVCIKVRKSQPDISIGTCTVNYGQTPRSIVICPFRMLERRQIFTDSLHLLTLHEPGNELHVIPEVSIPGGSVDYFLVSARNNKPVDFVGIELQTLDTTGTVWPARQKFLHSVGVKVERDVLRSKKSFGMNWKMTAKTILVQLHHKVDTFEHVSKHLVLVAQDCLLDYMKTEFSFGHIESAKIGNCMHFHVYSLDYAKSLYRINLKERHSTTAAGISTALGLQAQANVGLDTILADLERKMSEHTLWSPA
jgi:hypothetical protein